MKKVLLFLTISGFIFMSCHENKEKEKTIGNPTMDSMKAISPPLEWANYKSINLEDVKKLAEDYRIMILKKPANGIQQINMDGALLELLLANKDGFKLIAGFDPGSDKTTVILQFWEKDIFSYYDINTFFNSAQRGMRGQPPLCPPPAGCDLPLLPGVNPNVMTETEATEMAKHYNELVIKDPKIAIQQITMDALLLKLVLYSTEGLKIILAADIKSDETTAIIQLWRNGEFSYYDIRDIFTPELKGMRRQPPLCPPPTPCDLP